MGINLTGLFEIGIEHSWHKNVFHDIPFVTDCNAWLDHSIWHDIFHLKKKKVPFLIFVGKISVLKFCGCPAEIRARGNCIY